MNGSKSCSKRSLLRAANAAKGKNTSPRTSTDSGDVPFNTKGTVAMVRTLAVISSPETPSPRVTARTNRPPA